MRSTRELIELWDAKLPERRYDAEGRELFTSVMRRHAHAYRLQKEAERENPRLAEERRARLKAADEAQRQEGNQRMAEEFHAGTPQALSAIGLAEQEQLALAELQQRDAVRRARVWWEAPRSGKGLFLTLGGKPGGGKTVAAVSLLLAEGAPKEPWPAKEWIACESRQGWVWRPERARFVKAGQLARLGYFADADKRELERLTRVRLLLLDDLGAEAKFDTFSALLDELIDARARHQLRTVLTTNLPTEEVRHRYGERMFRRLRDFGEFVVVGDTLRVVP
jgi:DNA replication protein DnaC